MLSGHCSLALESEAGIVNVDEDPAETHARCNYTSLGKHGASIIACPCPHHEDEPYCDRCGTIGEGRCEDDAACATRLVEQISAYDNHLITKDITKALRAHGLDAAYEPAPAPPPKPRARRKPTGGHNECACGCGGKTGGTFSVGHDAKHKSALRKRWNREGDIDAYAELEDRGWLKSCGRLRPADVDVQEWAS